MVEILDLTKLFIVTIINVILVIVYLVVVPIELVLIVILLNTCQEIGLIHVLMIRELSLRIVLEISHPLLFEVSLLLLLILLATMHSLEVLLHLHGLVVHE